jgi:hypothetical protein
MTGVFGRKDLTLEFSFSFFGWREKQKAMARATARGEATSNDQEELEHMETFAFLTSCIYFNARVS